MTVRPLPEGADAVVMVERTRRDGDSVVIESEITPGRNMMHRGREMRAGEVVLERGEVLNAARLGLLASVGRSRVAVVPRPRVAVVSTGDELVDPDQSPGPGQIRNSNATVLRASRPAPGPTPRRSDRPRRAGRPPRILARGLDADVLLITGGVSAGNRDLVPEALAALGVRGSFTRSASSRASRSGSGSDRTRRRQAAAPWSSACRATRSAGSSGSSCSSGRRSTPSRPGRGRPNARSPPAWRRGSITRATARPTTPRVGVADGVGRAARLGGIGRPPDGRPCRRVRRLPGRRPSISQVKLSDSSPWVKIRAAGALPGPVPCSSLPRRPWSRRCPHPRSPRPVRSERGGRGDGPGGAAPGRAGARGRGAPPLATVPPGRLVMVRLVRAVSAVPARRSERPARSTLSRSLGRRDGLLALAIQWVRLTDPTAWLGWLVMALVLSAFWPAFLALARLAVGRLAYR